jgi:hypothetical protein
MAEDHAQEDGVLLDVGPDLPEARDHLVTIIGTAPEPTKTGKERGLRAVVRTEQRLGVGASSQ